MPSFTKKIFIFFFFCLLFTHSSQAFKKASRIKIDREYGNIHNVAVPQEFEIDTPDEQHNVLYPEELSEKDTYIKFQYFNDRQELKENFMLKYLKIPLLDNEKRILVIKKTILSLLAEHPKAALISIEQTKLNKYEMIVVHTQNGNYFLSFYGILNPDSIHCILGINNIDPNFSEVKKIDDLNNKKLGSGKKTLFSFSFGKELM